mmetsp:Transcript_13818/g.19802  ORF Transcript_13818/g.19802 Transcript_13818/m.19802 type:complete len:84 (+) Transcript_13818:59-310(+)
MKYWKVAVASHLTIFVLGFVVGDRLHKDELESYRSVYEAASDRWRRRWIKASLAVGSAVVLFVGARAIYRSPPNNFSRTDDKA